MASTDSEANLSNWRKSPYNQWAFQNIDRVLKTDIIQKSPHPTPIHRQLRTFTFTIESNGLRLTLPDVLDATGTDSFLVLHDGEIVYEEYFRENDQHSRHIIMSMTKSVTALLVGVLQGQGKLHVDDPVTRYVPEVAGTLYEDVTIRQCIDMRAGIVYDDDNQAYRAATGWNPLDGSEKYDNSHDFIANFHPERAVDDRFEYVSANTDLVGWVVERASGKTFAEAVQDLLWQPMGAESNALMTVDKAGHARAAGGLCATLRDVARIGQLIVEDGGGIIPREFVRDIVHGGDKEAFRKGAWTSLFPGFDSLAYRSHCLADSSLDLVVSLGIHGQMMFADRKNGIVIVKMSSQPYAVDAGINMTVCAFREIIRVLNSLNT